jgi:hypothetical protein
MGKNLQVVSKQLGVNFNCKYDNLAMSESEKIKVTYTNENGDPVRKKQMYQDKILQQGDLIWVYADDKGNLYERDKLTAWIEGEEAQEKEITKCFDIQSFDPIVNYTNSFIISKYYEISPSNNGFKSDYDRNLAIQTNLSGMRKLWTYLFENNVVGRSLMCVSSQGFTESDGYIRAIAFDNKWGLEIGIFSERKNFNNLQEETEFETCVQAPVRKRVRMI